MLNRHSDDELLRHSLDTRFFTSIRSLLRPLELPDAESLPDVELIALLNEIEFHLMQKQVAVDFLDQLPARVAYRGILQLLDSPLELDSASSEIKHVDGCDSACESCFQLAHCTVAREVLGPEWTLAVQQADINPSWVALFAQEDASETTD